MLSKLSGLSVAAQIASAAYYGPGPIFNGDCSNFNGENGCTSGSQTKYPDEWSKRSFQTWLKDGPDSEKWKPEY
jgi:hypothetical protein